MANRKKSRKTGLIGVRKSPDFKREDKDKRTKKSLGKPAGSRNNVNKVSANNKSLKVNKDPRLGSKKPIELIAPVTNVGVAKVKQTYFSPEEELKSIENNDKLSALLFKVDKGEALGYSDQKYVDNLLSRHRSLCDMLGINVDIENDQEIDDEELFDSLEKFDINKLKDF